MCVRAIDWALKAIVGDKNAKLVLIVLANSASDETLQCWPSVAYVAGLCEISRRTVYRAIIHLRENNFLTCEHRRWPNGVGRSPLFTLCLPDTPPATTVARPPATTVAREEPLLEPSQRKTPLVEKVWIGRDSPGWQVWEDHWRATRGIAPPTTTHQSELGWWFDSQEPKANGRLI